MTPNSRRVRLSIARVTFLRLGSASFASESRMRLTLASTCSACFTSALSVTVVRLAVRRAGRVERLRLRATLVRPRRGQWPALQVFDFGEDHRERPA